MQIEFLGQPFLAWGRHLAPIVGLLLLLATPLRTEAMPMTHVLLSGDLFHGGQAFSAGFAVRNPTTGVPAEFYFGLVAPDGNSRFVFSSDKRLSPVTTLDQIVPTLISPPGFFHVDASFLQGTMPDTGVASGTYQVFAALLRLGSLRAGQFGAGDILALDFKPVTVIPVAQARRDELQRFQALCEDEVNRALERHVNDIISRFEQLRGQLTSTPISFGERMSLRPTETKRFVSNLFSLPDIEIDTPGLTELPDVPTPCSGFHILLTVYK